MEHAHQAVRGGDLVDAVVVGQHGRQVDEPGADADGVDDKQSQDGGVAGDERQQEHRDAAQQLTEVTPGHVRRPSWRGKWHLGPRRNEKMESLEAKNEMVKQTEVLTHLAHINGWKTAYYMN